MRVVGLGENVQRGWADVKLPVTIHWSGSCGKMGESGSCLDATEMDMPRHG